MKQQLTRLIKLILISSFFTTASYAQQGNLYGDVRVAIKAGSSKELAKYYHKTIELNINGESKNFSKNHAEIYLKDFFNKYESVDFEYVHQGSSPEGLKYAIGSYIYSEGAFTVVIHTKKFAGAEKIYIIKFRKE
jgi:hypothetical protein